MTWGALTPFVPQRMAYSVTCHGLKHPLPSILPEVCTQRSPPTGACDRTGGEPRTFSSEEKMLFLSITETKDGCSEGSTEEQRGVGGALRGCRQFPECSFCSPPSQKSAPTASGHAVAPSPGRPSAAHCVLVRVSPDSHCARTRAHGPTRRTRHGKGNKGAGSTGTSSGRW